MARKSKTETETPAVDDQALTQALDGLDQASQAAPADPLPFDEQVAAIDEETRLEKAREIGAAFDARAAFQKAKDPNNEKIHVSLGKARGKLAMPSAAAVLIATSVPSDFISRSVSEGSMFNVYAADKVADLVAALKGGEVRNAINNAILRSLFKFRDAGEAFNGEMAKAAASDKIRVTGAQKNLLVRHTVSSGTAPTQSSSTMSALQLLGIVANSGTAKFPVYQLTDTPQTKKIAEVLKIAA